MANVYGRVAKISNAVGRSSYINDKERQEEIVLHKENMQYSWQEHSSFEKEHQKTKVANNEALEVHVALPNALAQDKEKLESVCDDLVKNIVGSNKDYEYSVHWNHNRTNLHVHILFSERENQKELEPKIYKKDIWKDRDTHRLAKAHAENAELVHKKGEIQRDKEGNIKYKTDIFKPKDTQYIKRNWVQEAREIAQKVLKSHGYDLDLTTKDSPYLSQKKLYKGASADYIEKAKEWNKEVKEYNKAIKDNLDKLDIETLVRDKKRIYDQVNLANKEEKKITPASISIVRQWKDRLLGKIKELTFDLKAKWEEMIQKDNEWVQLFFKRDRASNELKRTDSRKIDIADLRNQFEKDIKGVNQWRFKDRTVMKNWAQARLNEWNRRFDLNFPSYFSFKHGWNKIEQKALEINSRTEKEKEELKQSLNSISAQMEEKGPYLRRLKAEIKEHEPNLYFCGFNVKRDSKNKVYVDRPTHLPLEVAKDRLPYKDYYKDLITCVEKNKKYVVKDVKSIPEEERTLEDRIKLYSELKTETLSTRKEKEYEWRKAYRDKEELMLES